MKVRWPRKWLSDDPRANDHAVALNQLPVCLPWEDQLRESSHEQGVEDPQQDRGRDCHQHRCHQIFLHNWPNSSLDQPDPGDEHINQLDTDKGHDQPSETVYQQIFTQQRFRTHRLVLHSAQCQWNQRHNNQRVENNG